MPKIYLLSRTLDPILGIFTGLLAYKLHETNPRSAPAEGHTLGALLSWRWQLGKDRRAERELLEAGSGVAGVNHAAGATIAGTARQGTKGTGQGGEDEVWERMRRELEGGDVREGAMAAAVAAGESVKGEKGAERRL